MHADAEAPHSAPHIWTQDAAAAGRPADSPGANGGRKRQQIDQDGGQLEAEGTGRGREDEESEAAAQPVGCAWVKLSCLHEGWNGWGPQEKEVSESTLTATATCEERDGGGRKVRERFLRRNYTAHGDR